jgi:enterochelin esterase-like enzyme/sugar lactone lactonase YvrE
MKIRTIIPAKLTSLLCSATVAAAFGATANAQDSNGLFTISPHGSPQMALEAVNSGSSDGTEVSLGTPAATPNQKWELLPKGNNYYVIRPSYSTTLALAVSGAGTDDGTPIILETESDKPTELWSIKKNDNGTLSFNPKFAPDKGLDDFGGDKAVGAKQDLWTFNPDDEHLQWTLTPLPGAKMPVIATAAGAADASTQVDQTPPAQLDVPNPPQGVTKEFTFTDSKIYPGTTRNGVVFIPAQYDASKPACVYVQQDGYNPAQKAELEKLIAAGKMPVTVGVFIRPGDVPSPIAGMSGRRNRDFEYDGVSDNYVRFLTEELLPYVTKTFGLNLSTSGNDRCIAGASSGGIAAFAAAWQRPDAFSRVYACSGSFVGFRGGQEFPTMIRKFEAKPIRAYFTTATHDMENCAGDWFLLDQEMDKALKFSGYDYQFRINAGPHCSGWNDCFIEAMEFVWKDWPEPVQAGISAPRVRDIILPGANWEVASQGYGDTRGPACNSKGEVFFIDTAANKVYRIGTNGNTSVFVQDAARANGLCIDAQDNLYTVSKNTGNVMRYDASGNGTVYASGINGLYALAMPDGGLYVTADNKPDEPSKIWYIKDGKPVGIESDIKLPTGMAMRPDQWLLSVADGRSKWVYSYQIQPDGQLINKERFFWLHVQDWDDDAGPESVCYSLEGRMLVGTRAGIQISADDGPTQIILPMPDHSRVIGVCLGGPTMDTLFAFCGNKVWKRTVKIHASGAFTPATKVGGTPL